MIKKIIGWFVSVSIFRKKDDNHKWVKNDYDDEYYNHFKVAGAGKIIIGNDNMATCCGIKGFSIGVEWGKYGYAGGVISNEEAIKLAKHILRTNNLNKLLD